MLILHSLLYLFYETRDHGFGGCLSIGDGVTISHRFPGGSVRAVQHAARALTKAEMSYSQPDREGLQQPVLCNEIPQDNFRQEVSFAD